MIPLKYQVVGEEDYAFGIRIDADGGYVIDSGTYTSESPRKGVLTREQQQELLEAIRALGLPEEHPMPQGGTAFMANLTLGAEAEEITYPFWEGALEADEALNRLVRLLELI